MKVIGFLILISICCPACKNEYTPQEFLKEVMNSEKYKRIIKSEDMVYKVLFKPAEAVILMETYPEILSKEKYEEQIKEFENYLFFEFVIESREGNKKLMEKINGAQAIQYFSFSAMNDFLIMSEGEKFFPENYHFEKSAKGELRFSLLFKAPGSIKDKLMFSFEDHASSFGTVNFLFEGSLITGKPKINFN